MKKINFSRNKSSLIIAKLTWIIGSLISLSFNVCSEFIIFDKCNIFEFVIHISKEYMLTIGGAVIAICDGWVLPKHVKMESFANKNLVLAKIWVMLLKKF